MYSLPQSVTVDNRIFTITNKGDFRMVLDCFDALRDEELSEDYRVLASLLIFYNEFSSAEDIPTSPEMLSALVAEMFSFFNCGQDSAPGADSGRVLIDWNKDEQLVCAAVNNVANTEIRALEYLHWWTFMGYYSAVGESTLATVVSIRDKIMNGKKLEKWEQEFKKKSPHYFVWDSSSVEDKEMQKAFLEIWNQGGD